MLWDLNPELRQKRGNPNILQEGDEVQIPMLVEKLESIATGRRHTFWVRLVTSPLRLRLQEHGQPQAGVKYILQFEGGREQGGTTDGEGFINTRVPSWVRTARLTLQVAPEPEVYELRLGHLDPLEEIRGVQQRLSNLGIPCAVTGEVDEQTRWAVQTFQARMEGLEPNGDPRDPAMLQALRTVHGS
jgi:N-acetylmuramoyl-L-alanine amidase